MHNADIKPYLYRNKTLILMRPEAIPAFCVIESCKKEHLKELEQGKLPRSVGLTRVKNAYNNMTRDKKDWIFV